MATTPPKPTKQVLKGRQIWRTRWYDDAGTRRQKNFGYADEVTERQAKAAYAVWLSSWTTQDRVKNPNATAQIYSVADLAADYLAHAKRVFVKHGRMTSTCWNVAYAMQAILDAWGRRAASSIEAPDLAAVREAMIEGEDAVGRKYTRAVTTVNDRLFIIKQSFRWARERGLVSKEHLYDLMMVQPLKAGRCEAKAPRGIKPVDEHWVAITKPFCASPVRAMIDIQWLTGMRPGEAVIMRSTDIDMAGDCWLYTPHAHKMEHKGKVRVILIGPRAQEVIKPFLERPPTAYLFSPAEARAEQLAKKRSSRKTKLWPSHKRRLALSRTDDPQRAPRDRYSEESYRRAIHYGCRAAARAARKKDPEAIVPKWNPNQLRHAAATRFNKMFALEDVSVTLGHSELATTRIYAQPDLSKALEIARRIG